MILKDEYLTQAEVEDITLSPDFIKILESGGFSFLSEVYKEGDNLGFILGIYKSLLKGYLIPEIIVGDNFGEGMYISAKHILPYLLERFEKACRKKNIARIIIYTSNNIPEQFNYTQETAYTIIVDLQPSVDELWKNLKSKTRNETKQAFTRGGRVIEGISESDFDEFYELRVKTMARSNIKPEPKEVLHAVRKNLIPNGQAKLFLVKNCEGRTVAGGLFLLFKGVVYYWKGGSIEEGWPIRANNLLQWHVIKWAKENGFKKYNMVGATIDTNSPTYGVTQFKLGWGGELIALNKYTKVLSKEQEIIVKTLRYLKSKVVM